MTDIVATLLTTARNRGCTVANDGGGCYGQWTVTGPMGEHTGVGIEGLACAIACAADQSDDDGDDDTYGVYLADEDEAFDAAAADDDTDTDDSHNNNPQHSRLVSDAARRECDDLVANCPALSPRQVQDMCAARVEGETVYCSAGLAGRLVDECLATLAGFDYDRQKWVVTLPAPPCPKGWDYV